MKPAIGATRARKRNRRPTAHKRGYTKRWTKYAKAYLAANPFCVCGECDEFTPAECVDHIQPVTGPNDPLFWPPENHQALSFTCHQRKTNTETNGRALRKW